MNPQERIVELEKELAAYKRAGPGDESVQHALLTFRSGTHLLDEQGFRVMWNSGEVLAIALRAAWKQIEDLTMENERLAPVNIGQACRLAEAEKSLLDAREKIAVSEDPLHWAQALLTALNVGDVRSGSLLHLKLREVMIAHREALSLLRTPSASESRTEVAPPGEAEPASPARNLPACSPSAPESATVAIEKPSKETKS